jgi:putative addiction module component (TIGR02574 family)
MGLDRYLNRREHEPANEREVPAPGEARQMTLDGVSVFDLSPSEKLQLVEDLWDDLAATPEAVPVHDWQKEELARRKANLLSNPASGLSWEEVKRRVRSRYGR